MSTFQGSPPDHPAISSTLSSLATHHTTNSLTDPNYFATNPRTLLTSSHPQTFITGTGASIYRSIEPLLTSCTRELILVTCFWARSPSRETLNSILRQLSQKALDRNRATGGHHEGNEGKIRVRIGLSSLSLFQKLFHTPFLHGRTYPPSSWVSTLGLPDPVELQGLDLEIKSIFVLPFSVMHPKFIIVDRRIALLPSCNVSWEEWFEGAITLTGDVVDKFMEFYREFWGRGELPDLQPTGEEEEEGTEIPTLGFDGNRGGSERNHTPHTMTPFPAHQTRSSSPIPTLFLPSPHHQNPRWQPFRCTPLVRAPATPLNTFTLALFRAAEHSITIQTPNLTAPPVLSGLLNALERGIHVTILTSANLMVLEQLVTAGTTTQRCVKKLIKRYKQLRARSSGSTENTRIRDIPQEEAHLGIPVPGTLHISYFAPAPAHPSTTGDAEAEPQQSHIKFLTVDDEVVVLGSGNLDRASWFTSQELGVAFFDRAVVREVRGAVEKCMHGRRRVVFDGRDGEVGR